MTDEKGGDDKVLVRAGPRSAPGASARHPPLPEFDRLEIQHFFEVYKNSSPARASRARPGRRAEAQPRSRRRASGLKDNPDAVPH